MKDNSLIDANNITYGAILGLTCRTHMTVRRITGDVVSKVLLPHNRYIIFGCRSSRFEVKRSIVFVEELTAG